MLESGDIKAYCPCLEFEGGGLFSFLCSLVLIIIMFTRLFFLETFFSSSPRGGDLFRHYTRQGTNTGSSLGPLETRAISKASFGGHVAAESGLLVLVVSDAGTQRAVSGGVGDRPKNGRNAS